MGMAISWHLTSKKNNKKVILAVMEEEAVFRGRGQGRAGGGDLIVAKGSVFQNTIRLIPVQRKL